MAHFSTNINFQRCFSDFCEIKTHSKLTHDDFWWSCIQDNGYFHRAPMRAVPQTNRDTRHIE